MFIEAKISNTKHEFTTIVFLLCAFNVGFGKLYFVGVLYADFCIFHDNFIIQTAYIKDSYNGSSS